MNSKEINVIRGKILAGAASKKEVDVFMEYVNLLETLVEEASNEDFYGTEGWEHRLGWN